MFKEISKEINWAGSKLVLETGKVARQADGAVMVTYGDTKVLCTVVADKKAKEGIDFLPLTVHYREMYFAAGKIPGGFFKREGKPTEKEVLTSRLIDRPIRPLFYDHYYYETQIICTVLSFDNIHDADILALIGASAALAISRIPFAGPLAAAKVGYHDGQYVLNPKIGEIFPHGSLDLVVAGTKDSVLMVESEAKMLSEEIMLGAVNFGHQQMLPVLEMIEQLAAEVNSIKFTLAEYDYKDLQEQIAKLASNELKVAYQTTDKQQRYQIIDQIKHSSIAILTQQGFAEIDVSKNFKALQANIVRSQILNDKLRIDGRSLEQIRPINSEVSLLPRVHGSALFTRGETQVLAVTTLGSNSEEQFIDGLEGESKEHFMLHYNFPPYSVGEASPFRAPGRREIGHGKLAWRAIHQVLPTKADFPYTIRVVAEVTESNGSSSMATVCSGVLALMDAGVPISKPVAGIAMGLILEQDKFAVLSDILGDEDHLGDMDFKVAGTEDGITALQMDIKVRGISSEIMQVALNQAKAGRVHILGIMNQALNSPRNSLSENAPTVITIQINKDKIRDLIGPGGKVIKGICEETKAKIDIDDNGLVTISAVGSERISKARQIVEAIVVEAELFKVYRGKVVKLMEFGAFVNIMPGKDGFLHISEISNEKINDINTVLKEKDEVWAKVIGFDNKGKIKLSMKTIDQENGEDHNVNQTEASNSSEKPHNHREKSFKKPEKNGFLAKKSGNKEKIAPAPIKSEKRKYFS